MNPKEKARQHIDQLLNAAGWEGQNLRNLNIGASWGVAIREFPLKTGEADYLLFVDRNAVGIIEAKLRRHHFKRRCRSDCKRYSRLPEKIAACIGTTPFCI